MLADAGIDVSTYPVGARMGRVVVKKDFLEKLEITPQMPSGTPSEVMRTRWVVEDAPFFASSQEFFDDKLSYYPIGK